MNLTDFLTVSYGFIFKTVRCNIMKSLRKDANLTELTVFAGIYPLYVFLELGRKHIKTYSYLSPAISVRTVRRDTLTNNNNSIYLTVCILGTVRTVRKTVR